MSFPATRNDLIVHATSGGDGDEEALHALALLPEGTYDGLDDVVAALADHDRRASEAPRPTSQPHDLVADDD